MLAHAPLFLNGSMFMDDWLVLKPGPNYPVDIDFLFKGAGHPVFFAYYSFANMTGVPVLVMKTMAIAAILTGAICLFLAGARTGLLSRAEAAGVALLVWIYPGYQMWAGKANAVYVFSFGLFFVGMWLLVLAFKAKGIGHAALRLASASVFFLSFELNSLMALYVFAMFGLFVAAWRDCNRKSGAIRRLLLSGWRCIAGYPEFVVLPLLYWGALNTWFRRVGAYASYYEIRQPTFSDLLDGWHSFFEVGYMNVIARAGRAALDFKLLLIPIAVILVVSLVLAFKGRRSRWSIFRIGVPLLLSVLLFFALALPYLIAGIRPNLHFYETRHLLLFGLPGAFFVLAAKRVGESIVGRKAAFVGVFGLAAIVSLAALWSSYFFLQARALKQESLFSHLAKMPMPTAIVYDLNDGFADHTSQHVPFGLAEVTGMLQLAWGDHPFFGYSQQGERPTILQEMEAARNIEGSAFHHMDPSGPQATIVLEPGSAAAPNSRLVRHYYACRLLGRCDATEFLAQLANVKIDVGPIAGVLPATGSK
ncbi:MAG: hypothetical protein KGK01_09480 [Bradyrhizobium sp.]|nr:hypothetical protein [Pseudomonadota bacterium]MDE2067785.1 hypothetical protein [Bradyrhizobium sp.]MDE2242653.1 hypothetical protein [Bradyrhizobium sp.]